MTLYTILKGLRWPVVTMSSSRLTDMRMGRRTWRAGGENRVGTGGERKNDGRHDCGLHAGPMASWRKRRLRHGCEGFCATEHLGSARDCAQTATSSLLHPLSPPFVAVSNGSLPFTHVRLCPPHLCGGDCECAVVPCSARLLGAEGSADAPCAHDNIADGDTEHMGHEALRQRWVLGGRLDFLSTRKDRKSDGRGQTSEA